MGWLCQCPQGRKLFVVIIGMGTLKLVDWAGECSSNGVGDPERNTAEAFYKMRFCTAEQYSLKQPEGGDSSGCNHYRTHLYTHFKKYPLSIHPLLKASYSNTHTSDASTNTHALTHTHTHSTHVSMAMEAREALDATVPESSIPRNCGQ